MRRGQARGWGLWAPWLRSALHLSGDRGRRGGAPFPSMWAAEAKERMVEVCSHRTTRVPSRDHVSRKLHSHKAGAQQRGRVQ